MLRIQETGVFGAVVVFVGVAGAAHAVAQDVAPMNVAARADFPSVAYGQHSWVVDMRRHDGDPRRVTHLSGVFARDAAYYPFHDHIDEGSLRHVDRWIPDGYGGSYHQRGFVWQSHGYLRQSAIWSHYFVRHPQNMPVVTAGAATNRHIAHNELDSPFSITR